MVTSSQRSSSRYIPTELVNRSSQSSGVETTTSRTGTSILSVVVLNWLLSDRRGAVTCPLRRPSRTVPLAGRERGASNVAGISVA